MPSIYRNGIQFSTNCILESASITAGIIVPYAGDTAPTGWLLCDGSAVSRTTYSVLFDVIGTTYGSGDGSTTFNVPDLAGDDCISDILWTNNNPSAGFAAQALLAGQDLTVYDEIEVHGTNFTAYGSIMPTIRLGIGEKGNLIGIAGSSGDSSGIGFLVARGISVGSDRIIVSEAKGVATNGSSWGANNNNMIPTKVYGIKYGDVRHIISIGSQNGGFTHIKYDSQSDTYTGGIEDEYLLTDDTITALESWLNS